MKPSLVDRIVFAVFGLITAVGLAYTDASCTPAQRAAIPAEERAVCVLLTAADPQVAPYCATADELAPLVPVLAQQAAALTAAPDAAVIAPAPAPAIVAFSMPAPRHARPRMHCRPAPALDAGNEVGP